MLEGIEKITNEDRDARQQLTEAGREKAIRNIKKILMHYGVIDHRRIGEMLGISRATATSLVKEIIEEWKNEFEDRAIVQAKYFENLAMLRLEHPEMFTEDFKATISDVATLLGRANVILGLVGDKISKQDMLDLQKFIQAWSKLNPRTRSLLQDKQADQSQNNTNGTNESDH